MIKCPKYYGCDMATNGDYVSKSCEDIGICDITDKQKARCLEFRTQWEEFRKSLPDWEEE